MTFDAPTAEEIADATGQDFEQVARDFSAAAKATAGAVDDSAQQSSPDQ